VAERLGFTDFRAVLPGAGDGRGVALDPISATSSAGWPRTASASVVSPVGFAEHLEVLYDIDIEAQAVAREVGIHLERPRSMNVDPTFISAVADVATRALGAGTAAPTPAHALAGGSR
jgi:ferrochelatase